MSEVQILIGSLSNDLFRIASLYQRGSHAATSRLLVEAKRWSVPLENITEKMYIQEIAKDVSRTHELGIEKAETFLMCGTQLRNCVLHSMHNGSMRTP